jgi:four helix bundle protein
MSYTFYFEKLEVWKEGKDLAKKIYKLTDSFPNEEKFGAISQLRRSSLSISNNLAEGSSRNSKKDQANFTTIAYSSLMETLNLLIFSLEMDWINKENYQDLRQDIEKLANKLNSLRKSQLKG